MASAVVLGAESLMLTLPPVAQLSTSWVELLDTVDPLDTSGEASWSPKYPPAGEDEDLDDYLPLVLSGRVAQPTFDQAAARLPPAFKGSTEGSSRKQPMAKETLSCTV